MVDQFLSSLRYWYESGILLGNLVGVSVLFFIWRFSKFLGSNR